MPKPRDRPDVLLKKAKADEALLDAIVALPPLLDEIFGFHSQQAAEKAMKAVLAQKKIFYPRTHNLRSLMDLLGDNGIVLPSQFSDADKLTPFGTLARYEEADDPTAPALDRIKIRKLVGALVAWAERLVKGT